MVDGEVLCVLLPTLAQNTSNVTWHQDKDWVWTRAPRKRSLCRSCGMPVRMR